MRPLPNYDKTKKTGDKKFTVYRATKTYSESKTTRTRDLKKENESFELFDLQSKLATHNTQSI